MTLVKWRPARSIDFFRDFDSYFPNLFPPYLRRFGELEFNWTPTVDISETENAYELHAELPGMNKKEIEVSFQDDVLTIQGEKKHEEKKEDKKNGNYRRESRYGRFERSFRFTEPVQDEKITAQYKKGVLTIHVPKAEVPEPQKVEIK